MQFLAETEFSIEKDVAKTYEAPSWHHFPQRIKWAVILVLLLSHAPSLWLLAPGCFHHLQNALRVLGNTKQSHLHELKTSFSLETKKNPPQAINHSKWIASTSKKKRESTASNTCQTCTPCLSFLTMKLMSPPSTALEIRQLKASVTKTNNRLRECHALLKSSLQATIALESFNLKSKASSVIRAMFKIYLSSTKDF